MTLLRAREAVMKHFRGMLRQFNITEQQWRVLRALTSVEQIETTELAHLCYLLPPSLTRILRDLDKRQLIIRRSAENDGRRTIVLISPGGTALIEAVSPWSEAIYATITRELGQERLVQLETLLRELERTMLDLETADSEGERYVSVAENRPGHARGRPRKG